MRFARSSGELCEVRFTDLSRSDLCANRVAGRSITVPTAAIVTTTTTVATATARPGFTGLGLVDGQVPAVVLTGVQAPDRRLGLIVGVHLHESEPLRAIGVPINDDLGALDRPERGEQRLQVALVDVVGEVPDVQLFGQDQLRKKDDPPWAFRVEEKGGLRVSPSRRERRGRGAETGSEGASAATRSSDLPAKV